jgi:glycosyltransferase involved in cell wall biosynthesis
VHPEIKAFISLTRGEGFGLPLLEAAASGLPVIATGWSGHLSFLDLIRFIKLDYELQELPKARLDSNIFMAGAKWAQVHESDVKRKLKKFYDRPNIPKEWAVKGKSIIQEKFSFTAISAAYDVFWSKLESDKKLVI